jgi:hypothetical protein
VGSLSSSAQHVIDTTPSLPAAHLPIVGSARFRYHFTVRFFLRTHPNEAARISEDFLRRRSPEELREIVADIDDELSSPKQRVQHILNQSQTEESLRVFLRRFADIVSEQLEWR